MELPKPNLRDEPYYQNCQRICEALEEKIPQLKRDTAGKDFRPDGKAELIVGGLVVHMPDDMSRSFLPATEPLDANRDIAFGCRFGGEALWKKALEGLHALGIDTTVKLPHLETIVCDGEETVIRVSTWWLSFTLPQDWQLPITT